MTWQTGVVDGLICTACAGACIIPTVLAGVLVLKTVGVMRLSVATWVGLAAVGCRAERISVRHSMQSVDAASRVRAIQRAAIEGDSSAVPNLVDRLEDEDAAVRFAALLALERITGERLGYEYGASVERRASATARWRAHLNERTRAAVPHADADRKSETDPG